uniref:Uncharacterized protein n=1 Tax=Candidatus Kentrum sp. TUN TaxID=2126343 RepID=A0A450ZTL2_9GAMM|nr:MAG: hypothetical protein BECKTUN1418F_GA0071002_11043 [Candidatus Kentron sp. TUN]VFK65088.1 MAG: hypothetical protein BECKTUN1418E_GA0071001_11013 [Candidatus Kentron sp. TUN]
MIRVGFAINGDIMRGWFYGVTKGHPERKNRNDNKARFGGISDFYD